jgi:hypothetical protein
VKAAKLLTNGKLRVDVLKLPHHGSERNVAPNYFETIVAKQSPAGPGGAAIALGARASIRR